MWTVVFPRNNRKLIKHFIVLRKKKKGKERENRKEEKKGEEPLDIEEMLPEAPSVRYGNVACPLAEGSS